MFWNIYKKIKFRETGKVSFRTIQWYKHEMLKIVRSRKKKKMFELYVWNSFILFELFTTVLFLIFDYSANNSWFQL